MAGSDDIGVYLDFSLNGGAYPANNEIITDFVESIRFTVGRESANPLTGKMVAGSCTVVMRNDDDDWSPYNSSGQFYNEGVRPWVGARLWVNFSGDTVQSGNGVAMNKAWMGQIDSIKPTVVLSPTGGKIKRATITARGYLSVLAGLSLATQSYTDTTSGILYSVYEDLNSELGVPPIQMFPPTDAFAETIMTDGERWIGRRTPERFWCRENETILDAFRRLADFEGGDLIEARQVAPVSVSQLTMFMQRGDYRTWWTYAKAPEDSLLFTDEARSALDATDIPYTYIELINSNNDIINLVKNEVFTYETESIADLWTDSTTPLIPANGGTLVVYVPYPNSSAVANAIGVDTWTAPVGTTDFTANTEADGSGTDRTSDVSAVISYASFTQVRITYTNSHATDDVFLTTSKVRGTAVTKGDSEFITKRDADSIDQWGIRQFSRSNDLETDYSQAEGWVDRTLQRYKDPHPAVRIVFSPNYSENAAIAGYKIQIGDRIEIKANDSNGTGLGFQEFFYVERIAHDIQWPEGGEKSWRCELLCSWTPPLTALAGNLTMSGAISAVGP